MRILASLSAAVVFISALFCPAAAAASGSTFHAEPFFPDSQPVEKGWFDLVAAPGEHHTLHIQLTNSSAQPVVAQAILANATTTDDGFIDYTGTQERQKDIPCALTDLITLDQSTINVPAGTSALLTASVTVPPSGFDGTLLGGICIRLQESNQESTPVDAIRHVLPISLSTRDNTIQPAFQPESMFGGLMNYRACITAPVRNVMPATARNISVHAELFQAGRQESFYQVARTIDMAPYSTWNCRFPDQNGAGYAPGDYTMRMALSYDGTIHELEQTFTLTADDVDFIRENTVTLLPGETSDPQSIQLRIVIHVAVLAVLVLLLIFTLRKRPYPEMEISD